MTQDTTGQPQQLDPEAVNLAKAIRQTESGGNFTAQGKSGEYGAYQFTEPTWNATASKYGVNVPLNQATPEQQNEVAYKQIKDWKDQGNNVGQIASMWNSGENNKNAYLDNSYKGVNKYGASYNVPAYAKSVATAYQTLKSGGQVQADPNNPSSTANQTPLQNQPQESLLQKAGDVAGGVANFAFPILGDIKNDVMGGQPKKSLLAQAADLGLSGLWFLPGIGEGSGLIGNALKGATLGYGAGTLSNLSQGKGLAESIAPNLSNLAGGLTGGVAGAVIPKIASALNSQFSEGGALKAVTDNLGSEVSRTVPGKTLMSNLPENGQRALKLITQSGAIPEVSGNSFAVDDAIQKMQDRIGQLGQARAAAIEKVAPMTSLDDLAAQAKAKIDTIPADATDAEKHLIQQKMFSGEVGSMQKKIDSIVTDIKTTTGKTELSAPELEALKEAQMANSGIFKRTGAIGDQNAASLLGGVAKDKIESLATDAGFPGMQEYNQYIKDHYDAIKVLQRLGKQTVKGGRLGNMLTGHAVGTVAGMAQAATGGGFLGSIGGLLAGEGAGNFLSKLVGENSISNPLRDAVLQKIQQENPQIVQELMQFAGKTGKVAPLSMPKTTRAGMLPSLLVKGAARVGGLAQ